ncbi:AAA family ATPase [Zhongshania sp. BJYM1]|uniref:AAA family ATPase n=1 Tax=Zhongshania aquatica TaxID=2965069 RepID=UPI0022B477BF|nr:AAA family ATPase [Marortus sp. BJYM1]
MNEEKQLWLLAGGNGSGKSTFYRTQLQPHDLPFVNADILAKELFPEQPEQHSYEAAKLAEQIRLQLLRDGRTFCFETVFSHPSKIDFVAQAKALGYEIELVFIHLDNTALNNARVSQRVEEGGHNVPENKVNERIPRTLQNIKSALPLCDRAYFLDNSRSDNPFKQIAVLGDGEVTAKQSPLPQWAKDILMDYLAE